MKRAATAAFLLMCISGPAAATETMICVSPQQEVSVSLLMGSLDVIAIASASIEFGGKRWATDAEGDLKIVVGQAFEDNAMIAVDLSDEGLNKKIAELRLIKTEGSDGQVIAGTVRMPGEGAWPVNCSE